MKTSIQFVATFLTCAFCSAAHADSLISYYEAEGNANATVGTDGNLINGAGFAAGQYGQGFSFNGASQQYVEVPGGGGLDGATNGTISMWVQWNGTQDAACCGGTFGNVLARQNNGIFSNNVIGLNNSNPNAGGLTWQPYGAGAPTISSTTPVGDGTMRHVAVTFSNGHHVLYLDGTPVGSAATNGNFNSNALTPLTIGSWFGDGSGYSTAVVDDVAIYNRELSINQIQSIAGGTAPTAIQDPISGVTATASSSLLIGFNRPVGNIVDGVGRSTVVPDGNPGSGQGMWLSSGTGFGTNPSDPNPQVTFDLGQQYDLGGMNIFNYNEVNLTGRGVDQFEVFLSNDNFNADIRSAGVFDLDPATGNMNNPGQTFMLDGLAQYVRFDILSNQNGSQFPNGLNNVDFNFVGLNEVEFFTAVAPVPEPGSVALWLLAGATLVALRRRSKR